MIHSIFGPSDQQIFCHRALSAILAVDDISKKHYLCTVMEENIEKYSGHFSEESLWDKMVRVARKAGMEVIYGVLLLYYVLASKTTSTSDKAKIVGALGYFILPLDLVPDALPLVGYTDDLAAISW